MGEFVRKAFYFTVNAVLFAVVFAGVAVAVAWWRVTPTLFETTPICVGECEYEASCDTKDDASWHELALWDVRGTPDVTKYQDLARAEFLADFNARSRISRTAASVGRLQLLLDAGGQCIKAACTGALISNDRILTAAHCADVHKKPARVLRAAIRFGFVSETPAGEGRLFELDPATIERAPPTMRSDFMLLRFADQSAVAAVQSAGAVPIKLAAERPGVGDDLYIVGHPYGGPQIVLRAQCRVRLPRRAGSEEDPAAIIRHTCGTAPGISGAPIFDDVSGALIGIHTEVQEKFDEEAADIGYGIPLSEMAAGSATIRARSSTTLSPAAPVAQP